VFWDPATGRPLGEPMSTTQNGLLSVAVSADGRWLASGGKDGTVVLWDVEKRQPRDQPLDAHREVHSLAFSPDGKLLATASGNDTVLLWDLEHQGAAAESLKTNHAAVWEVDFSPNGQVLAVVSAQVNSVAENKLVLWDVHSRQPLGELAQIWPVFGIAFRPQSGDELAAAAGDGSMTLWRTDPQSWTKLACSVVNRNLSRREWVSLAGESTPFRAVCPELPEYLETMR
jgi:WD40 repeat protein